MFGEMMEFGKASDVKLDTQLTDPMGEALLGVTSGYTAVQTPDFRVTVTRAGDVVSFGTSSAKYTKITELRVEDLRDFAASIFALLDR